MSDAIALRGVRAFGRHGANPGEQHVPQPFDIDVVLELDLTAARQTDRLTDTVDYATLHTALLETVATTSYALLERLGQALLDVVFADPRVQHAELSIAKPRLLAGATPVVTVRQNR